MGTKNNPGLYDCWEKAEPDEPAFVLLARDPLAPRLVSLWASMRAGLTKDEADPKSLEAAECAQAMRDWYTQKNAIG